VPRETSILGSDQHAAIERVDLVGFDRQPPLAVGGQKTAQDRPVEREDENRRIAPAIERRRRESE